MLVVLFGSTGEMGQWSRVYLQNKGFELIQKFNYIPEKLSAYSRYGHRIQKTREEVLSCDFVYEREGLLVGFNKDQIIDAVRGRKQCLITSSADTIDFLRQIKAAYGDYVVVIGTYIDNRTLRSIYDGLPDMSDDELQYRLRIGVQVKKIILENRNLFDHILLYGGEDSVFNMESLSIQFDDILERAAQTERELNNRMYVEMPYSGNEDYIFASYSHKDVISVFPVLRQLQLAGFRIWYDEGINGGENWRKIVASKIMSEKCKDVLLFSSENSIVSVHVNAEVNLSLDIRKKIITVRLDDQRFDPGIEMYLSGEQCIAVSDSDSFTEKLIKALDSSTRIQQE